MFAVPFCFVFCLKSVLFHLYFGWWNIFVLLKRSICVMQSTERWSVCVCFPVWGLAHSESALFLFEFCKEQLPLLHYPDVPAQKSYAVRMEAEVRKGKRKKPLKCSGCDFNKYLLLFRIAVVFFSTLSIERKRKAIMAWKTHTVSKSVTKSISEMF